MFLEYSHPFQNSKCSGVSCKCSGVYCIIHNACFVLFFSYTDKVHLELGNEVWVKMQT